MKLEVIFAANRRKAIKAAAQAYMGLFAYPLGGEEFGLVKCYKSKVTVIQRGGVIAPYHRRELTPAV